MMPEPTEHSAIIVGAGPAGLAVGACLKRRGIPFQILEQGEGVATSWRRHYDRLHLHTDKKRSALPYFPFPEDHPRYPSRLQVIEYLEAYARRFELEPRFGERVVGARRAWENEGWEVETEGTRYRADRLVVATGHSREPHRPNWPGRESFRGTVTHSARYRNGKPFGGRDVLVVGFGNSGGEIAIDLCEHGADVSMAVRGPVNVIPREIFGIPILAVSRLQSMLPPRLADTLNAPLRRLLVGDLSRYGLQQSPEGPMSQIRRRGRVPLIDVGTIDLIKQGRITVFPGIERFTEDGVVFADGRRRRFDAVILSTGYRPCLEDFLDEASEACDEGGVPLTSGGTGPVRGLYFCGFHVSSQGMLRVIGREARQIAAAMEETS